MVLSDRTIREQIAAGRLVIDPFDEALLQPSSVDLRVSDAFRVFRNNRQPFIDPSLPEADLTEVVTIAQGEPFILHPGEFVLGSTLERVGIPDDLVARLEGKSSLGRLGLLIHSTAGYIDPGFEGQITLDINYPDYVPVMSYAKSDDVRKKSTAMSSHALQGHLIVQREAWTAHSSRSPNRFIAWRIRPKVCFSHRWSQSQVHWMTLILISSS